MITQNSGFDEVKKWIKDEMKRSEQLKALITAENKETIIKVLEIVYDRVMDCEGTLLTESGEKVANVIDGQDAMDAICCTIEEVKNTEPKLLVMIDKGYTIKETKDGGIEVSCVNDNGGKK